MTVFLTFVLTLTAVNVIRVLLEFTVNDEVTMRTLYCLYQESSKPSKTNAKRDRLFLFNSGFQQICFALFFFFCLLLCYVILCNVMPCHVNRHSCNIISRHVMLCNVNYLFLFLFKKKNTYFFLFSKATIFWIRKRKLEQPVLVP